MGPELSSAAELMSQHLAAIDARLSNLENTLRLIREIASTRGERHATYVTIADAALSGRVLPRAGA